MSREALILRPVTKGDRRLLWEWANDKDVRQAAFSSAAIGWDEHAKWFERKQNDPDCVALVAMDEAGVPVGQARIDLDKGEPVIDISVDKQFRGKGFAVEIIKRITEVFFREKRFQDVNAYVKLNNVPSLRAFETAGFQMSGKEIVKGQEAMHLRLKRGSHDG